MLLIIHLDNIFLSKILAYFNTNFLFILGHKKSLKMTWIWNYEIIERYKNIKWLPIINYIIWKNLVDTLKIN